MKSFLLPILCIGGMMLATACIPDPVIPDWQAEFEAFADTSKSFPAGSGLLRCYWDEEWVFLVENPLSSCLACQVITTGGDTISLLDSDLRQDYLDNRRQCEQVWRKD